MGVLFLDGKSFHMTFVTLDSQALFHYSLPLVHYLKKEWKYKGLHICKNPDNHAPHLCVVQCKCFYHELKI